MKNNVKVIIGIIIAILVIWGVFNLRGRQGSPNGDADNGATPTKTADDVSGGDETGSIKIGYIGPLTGEAASAGEPGLAGAEAAVKEINDAGGVLGRQLELVAEDDQCSAKGAEAISKLINVDKVVAIDGPDCSASGGPALPIAQEAGVPVVVRWASAPNLTKVGDFIYRVYPSDAFQGGYAADFIFNTLGKKKAALIYVQNDWGEGLRQVFKEKFTAFGGEIVAEEGILQDSTDLKTSLTKVKGSSAEVLYAPIYFANAAAGLKQAKELQIEIPIIGGDAYDTDEIIKSPGAEGTLYTVAIVSNPDEFKSKVESLTGKKADSITAPMSYDAIKIIAEAITKAGSTDKVSIKEALKSTSYEGVSTPLIEFDENGDLKSAQFEVKIIKNGVSVKYN